MRTVLPTIAALALLGGCISVDREDPLLEEDVSSPQLDGSSDGVADGSGPDAWQDVPVPPDSGGPDTPPIPDDGTPPPDTPVNPDTPTPDVPVTPDAKDTVDPDTGPTLCPGLQAVSVAVEGDRAYARFGEEVQILGSVQATTGVETTITVTPPELQPFLEDHGDGTATFVLDEVPLDFQTTEVTFHLECVVGRCLVERTVSMKVLGNVWISDRDDNVVHVFRSDGSSIMQGVPSTYLADPWSLTQLDSERFLVGNRYDGGGPIYDFDGNKVGQLDEEDALGQWLWSVYGAYSALVHAPDGKLWVGGVRGQILVFEPDGTYVETLYLEDYNMHVEDMWQLPDGSVVLLDDSSFDWEMTLVDEEAETIGPWGDNGSSQLKLVIEAGTPAPNGDFVVAGRMGTGTSAKGFLARLKGGGQMLSHSEPLSFWPRYGLTAFGEGFLVSADDDRVVLLNGDLEVVDDDWADEAGATSWTAILVAGGN